MPDPKNDTFAEFEKNQAALADTIEESKRLLRRSQQLLDWNKKKSEPAGT